MKKINIAEILKDCPSGMELDCTMYEDCKFLDIDTENDGYLIRITTPCGLKYLDKYGRYTIDDKAKCIIFPKGKTTWEGFQRPFKEGDIVATLKGNQIFIFKENIENIDNGFRGVCYFGVDFGAEEMFKEGLWYFARLATEEEKEKLFQAIKDNGYKWSPETKTLEKLIKPKFKVGDWIEFKYYERKPEKVIRIVNNVYWLSSGATLMFQDESAWDLTTKKFDITTLKPFDKVLVRTDSFAPIWTIDFYDGYSLNAGIKSQPFGVSGGRYFQQCIPYEGNEHLRGTTNDCDEYYKTWK